MSWLKIAAAALALSAAAAPAEAAAPEDSSALAQALRNSRQRLEVTPEGLSGAGAAALLEAIGAARYIAVGEDHLTQEVPTFVGQLCRHMQADLSGLVLETGPNTLAALSPMLKSGSRLAEMARFNADYPSGVAFLNTRHDNDMVASCVARVPELKLIGVDQEFLGSAGLLLDRILATRLSGPARREMMRLRALERERSAAARASGDPGDLFLLKVAEPDLERGEAALKAGGNPLARSIFADLRKSREIYLLPGNASNMLRATLLKKSLAAQAPRTGKILLKMGDWHLYRGYNPLNNRDLGNYVAEAAEMEGSSSLHILVLGAKGTHALYGGYARPLRLEPFAMRDDRDYGWIGLAVDQMEPNGWTLFDLRKVRGARPSGLDVAWRRVLDGYDFLVLVPEITPSGEIGSP